MYFERIVYRSSKESKLSTKDIKFRWSNNSYEVVNKVNINKSWVWVAKCVDVLEIRT
jgi:hypothetical protein